jgi:hypothetical protein
VQREDVSRKGQRSCFQLESSLKHSRQLSSLGIDEPRRALYSGDLINDEDALKPDASTEADFVVKNNPFLFPPGQFSKIITPKI